MPSSLTDHGVEIERSETDYQRLNAWSFHEEAIRLTRLRAGPWIFRIPWAGRRLFLFTSADL
jgi:hypothetical protein